MGKVFIFKKLEDAKAFHSYRPKQFYRIMKVEVIGNVAKCEARLERINDFTADTYIKLFWKSSEMDNSKWIPPTLSSYKRRNSRVLDFGGEICYKGRSNSNCFCVGTDCRKEIQQNTSFFGGTLVMKAKVTLTFDINSNDYHSVESSEESIRELVKAMLNREADLPDDIEIDVEEI